MTDIFVFLQWYGILFLIGLAMLPITIHLFSTFTDKGYVFSKIFGIITLSYLIFVVGTLKILPFTILSIILILTLIIGANIFFLKRSKPKITRSTISIWVIEELIFFLSLAAWTFVRGHEPSINGLEKFMDFGFVNTILRSHYFPPVDMWFPPLPINYYYFGHLYTAVITKLSLLPSNYTYNLMIATIFAFSMTASFSIGYTICSHLKHSMRRSIITGILAAALVSLAGNLHIIYAFFETYTPAENPVPIWELAFQPLSLFTNGYWYPNATRFIPNTIHEFPLYSFVVSDLHGHVLDIPVVLLFLAFLYTVFYSKQLTFLKKILLGFLLSVMYMTNVLDAGIYFMLTFFVLTYMLVIEYSQKKKKKSPFPYNQFVISGIKTFGTILISAAIFTLPFSLFFKPFASGVGVLCSPNFLTSIGQIGPLLFEPNHCQRSEWWMLLTLYGFFLFFVTILFVYLWKYNSERVKKSYFYLLILSLVSILLIVIPEFFYIKDIYPDHYRANTMFKLTYQSFIMLSIVSAIVITTIVIARKNIILIFLSFVLVTLVLTYPRFAIDSYYDLNNYIGTDGTVYLKDRYPDDYSAIQWINNNISGQPVILESQGDSYTDHARISANTGLPTVLGWTVHEWLWRGSYDIPAPRVTDVQTLYESTSLEETKELLNKYNVELVYIGTLEYDKYPSIDTDKFLALGEVIYRNNGAMVIKIRD